MTLPVVTVLPTDEPDTMPHRALEITATFAGPPADEPARELASLIKNPEIPVRSRNAPKMMNTAMYLEQTLIGVERMPVFL